MYKYPTKKQLKTIENLNNPRKLIEHIEKLWWTPKWGFSLKNGRDHLFRKKCLKLELHTGGWSGNEGIIAALQKTHFWFLYWQRSDRGGHYYFEIPSGDLILE